MAQGFASADAVGAAFKAYLGAVYPYTKEVQGAEDARLLELMKEEAAKGPITFKTHEESPLQRRAKVLRDPDPHWKSLRENVDRRKGLRR